MKNIITLLLLLISISVSGQRIGKLTFKGSGTGTSTVDTTLLSARLTAVQDSLEALKERGVSAVIDTIDRMQSSKRVLVQ